MNVPWPGISRCEPPDARSHVPRAQIVEADVRIKLLSAIPESVHRAPRHRERHAERVVGTPTVQRVDGDATDFGVNRGITHLGFGGCGAPRGQTLQGHGDWANLRCDFRFTADLADGVHRYDIGASFAARNTSAGGPEDPMDANGDGDISVSHARECVLECTDPRCAPEGRRERPRGRRGGAAGFPPATSERLARDVKVVDIRGSFAAER